MKNIKIEFSGNLEIEADNVVMIKFNGKTTTTIKGDEWLELPEEDRSDYTLESFGNAYNNCFNCDFTLLEVEELL